jgi:hypothetical protein
MIHASAPDTRLLVCGAVFCCELALPEGEDAHDGDALPHR